MKNFEDAAVAILGDYRETLVRSDADAIATLYAPDAVLMPQNSPASVGIDAIRATYGAMLNAIGLDIRFEIAELRQLAPDWGFARTSSNGTITINATGGSIPEANQELFLFQRIGESWKIARYAFSTTLPQQA